MCADRSGFQTATGSRSGRGRNARAPSSGPGAGGVVLLAIALAGGATGCATHAAPDGLLPDPMEAQTDAYGSWIQLTVAPDSSWVTGELIAVSEDSVWVLGLDGRARVVAADAVTSGKLVAYDAEHGKVAVATLLGIGSTISNGAFLMITGPLWLLLGTVAAANHSRIPIQELPPVATDHRADSWAGLAPFARFPQGLPPDMRPESLRPRPVAYSPLESRVWASAAGGFGVRGFARIVGVGVGESRWTVRGRFVRVTSTTRFGHYGRDKILEAAVLLGYRPPQLWDAVVYDVAIGVGRAEHRGIVLYPCDYPDPDLPGTGQCAYHESLGPLHGPAFTIGVGRSGPRTLDVRLEVYGNLNPWHPFAGLAVALQLGRLPR